MPAKSNRKPAGGKAAPKRRKTLPTIKRPVGAQPIAYDQAIADYICEQLILPRSLRSICNDKNMPDRGTVMRWYWDNEDFSRQYTRAREIQADVFMDEIPDIADDGSNDYIERKHFAGADESPQLNGEALARSRLRIDTRKWLAGQVRPKKWGINRIDVDQTVSVSPDLAALMDRVASSGQRLAHDEDKPDE